MNSESTALNRQLYNSMIKKRAALVAALLIIVIMLLLLNISLGSSSISLEEIIRIIFTGEGEGHKPMIVNRIRLPMALMAVAVGACLGIGGCEIQTILRNPIASPYTLGITNAASFGAALGLILDANVLNVSEPLMVTANAFTFALLASSLVYAFSRRRGAGKHTIILFGIALNFLFTALTMILQYIADDEDLQSLVFWNMGSLLKTTWFKFLLVFAVLIFCFAIFYKNSWKLTAMTLEDTKARSLGVDTHKIRRMVILLASLLTAFAVCFVGAIGFVGIIAPPYRAPVCGGRPALFPAALGPGGRGGGFLCLCGQQGGHSGGDSAHWPGHGGDRHPGVFGHHIQPHEDHVMLKVQNLSFGYGGPRSRRMVFKELNLTFQPGLSVILGPNGAGKSTLLKSIFGLLKYEGVIFYAGENLTRMKTDDKTKLMSYLPQMDIETSMLTVLEMVLLGRLPELGHKVSDHDLDIVVRNLDALNITSLARRNFGELSGGQKKLVFIAQTLVREPRLILLDEPVNSLDLQKQLELCQLLQNIVKEQKVDIIVVMHDINLAVRYAQNLIILDSCGGLHSAGVPGQVITSDMLRQVYGVIADVSHGQNGVPLVSPVCSIRDA